MNDTPDALEAHDFFHSDRFINDPYPYFDFLRDQAPVLREPHHGIFMVTGYAEALEVYNDPARFSSRMSTSGPFAGCPIPLEGRENDDISELIAEYRDQTLQRSAPYHGSLGAHRSPVATDVADYPEAPQGKRGLHVEVGRRADRHLHCRRQM